MGKAVFICQLDSETQQRIATATAEYLADMLPDATENEIRASVDNILAEKISTLLEWDFMRYLDTETFNIIANL